MQIDDLGLDIHEKKHRMLDYGTKKLVGSVGQLSRTLVKRDRFGLPSERTLGGKKGEIQANCSGRKLADAGKFDRVSLLPAHR